MPEAPVPASPASPEVIVSQWGDHFLLLMFVCCLKECTALPDSPSVVHTVNIQLYSTCTIVQSL